MGGISKSQLLISGGSLLLVSQLIMFQSAFDIVEPPRPGTLRSVLSGGLLLIATLCIASGAYLRYQRSSAM